jgi:hypothetical protein
MYVSILTPVATWLSSDPREELQWWMTEQHGTYEPSSLSNDTPAVVGPFSSCLSTDILDPSRDY